MRKTLPVIGFLTALFIHVQLQAQPHVPSGPTPYTLKTVVIDAGHGGNDQGCSGGGFLEKTVALQIALKLGALIEKNYPDVKVIYTRKTDVFVELYERAAIANRNNADLFICIHCNANPNTSPYGTETYVMGLHKTEANLNVAKRENDVILMEDNYTQHYDGFDPNNPASHIIFSLNQHAFMDQSILFASKVESYLKSNASRSSRGVKQAGFLVLWKTTMPSVLIETGFLTNGNESKYLGSDAGQGKIAESVYFAFRDYKNNLEKNSGAVNKEEISRIEDNIDKGDNSDAQNTPAKGEVYYAVQFFTSNKEENVSRFNALKSDNITFVKEGGLYKYRLGPYNALDTATDAQKKARSAGYSDAFVIALKDGVRISMDEARQHAAQ
ncbi:MAG: N-acetylmuramoyl-L-alanine amidase [Chitinophagales bacterium]